MLGRETSADLKGMTTRLRPELKRLDSLQRVLLADPADSSQELGCAIDRLANQMIGVVLAAERLAKPEEAPP